MNKFLLAGIVMVVLTFCVLLLVVVSSSDFPIQVDGSRIIITLEVDDWVTVRDYGLIASVTVRRPMPGGSDCTWKERIAPHIEEIIIDRRKKILTEVRFK